MEVLARALALIFLNKSGQFKHALIFPHKSKSICHSKLEIVLFVCTHNKENNQGGLDLEQEHFTKTEPKLSKYLPH